MNNYLVLPGVLLVAIIGIGIVIWLLWLKQRHKPKGHYLCVDSIEARQTHPFLLTINTGWRWDAGTFAELAVRLVSSKKRSLMFNLSNCPDREILKTGGSDTFFLLLEGHFGDVTQVELYVTGCGQKDDWFLTSAQVTNLMRRESWYFPIGQWVHSRHGVCEKYTLNRPVCYNTWLRSGPEGIMLGLAKYHSWFVGWRAKSISVFGPQVRLLVLVCLTSQLMALMSGIQVSPTQPSYAGIFGSPDFPVFHPALLGYLATVVATVILWGMEALFRNIQPPGIKDVVYRCMKDAVFPQHWEKMDERSDRGRLVSSSDRDERETRMSPFTQRYQPLPEQSSDYEVTSGKELRQGIGERSADDHMTSEGESIQGTTSTSRRASSNLSTGLQACIEEMTQIHRQLKPTPKSDLEGVSDRGTPHPASLPSLPALIEDSFGEQSRENGAAQESRRKPEDVSWPMWLKQSTAELMSNALRTITPKRWRSAQKRDTPAQIELQNRALIPDSHRVSWEMSLSEITLGPEYIVADIEKGLQSARDTESDPEDKCNYLLLYEQAKTKTRPHMAASLTQGPEIRKSGDSLKDRSDTAIGQTGVLGQMWRAKSAMVGRVNTLLRRAQTNDMSSRSVPHVGAELKGISLTEMEAKDSIMDLDGFEGQASQMEIARRILRAQNLSSYDIQGSGIVKRTQTSDDPDRQSSLTGVVDSVLTEDDSLDSVIQDLRASSLERNAKNCASHSIKYSEHQTGCGLSEDGQSSEDSCPKKHLESNSRKIDGKNQSENAHAGWKAHSYETEPESQSNRYQNVIKDHIRGSEILHEGPGSGTGQRPEQTDKPIDHFAKSLVRDILSNASLTNLQVSGGLLADRSRGEGFSGLGPRAGAQKRSDSILSSEDAADGPHIAHSSDEDSDRPLSKKRSSPSTDSFRYCVSSNTTKATSCHIWGTKDLQRRIIEFMSRNILSDTPSDSQAGSGIVHKTLPQWEKMRQDAKKIDPSKPSAFDSLMENMIFGAALKSAASSDTSVRSGWSDEEVLAILDSPMPPSSPKEGIPAPQESDRGTGEIFNDVRETLQMLRERGTKHSFDSDDGKGANSKLTDEEVKRNDSLNVFAERLVEDVFQMVQLDDGGEDVSEMLVDYVRDVMDNAYSELNDSQVRQKHQMEIMTSVMVKVNLHSTETFDDFLKSTREAKLTANPKVKTGLLIRIKGHEATSNLDHLGKAELKTNFFTEEQLLKCNVQPNEFLSQIADRCRGLLETELRGLNLALPQLSEAVSVVLLRLTDAEVETLVKGLILVLSSEVVRVVLDKACQETALDMVAESVTTHILDRSVDVVLQEREGLRQHNIQSPSIKKLATVLLDVRSELRRLRNDLDPVATSPVSEKRVTFSEELSKRQENAVRDFFGNPFIGFETSTETKTPEEGTEFTDDREVEKSTAGEDTDFTDDRNVEHSSEVKEGTLVRKVCTCKKAEVRRPSRDNMFQLNETGKLVSFHDILSSLLGQEELEACSAVKHRRDQQKQKQQQQKQQNENQQQNEKQQQNENQQQEQNQRLNPEEEEEQEQQQEDNQHPIQKQEQLHYQQKPEQLPKQQQHQQQQENQHLNPEEQEQQQEDNQHPIQKQEQLHYQQKPQQLPKQQQQQQLQKSGETEAENTKDALADQEGEGLSEDSDHAIASSSDTGRLRYVGPQGAQKSQWKAPPAKKRTFPSCMSQCCGASENPSETGTENEGASLNKRSSRDDGNEPNQQRRNSSGVNDDNEKISNSDVTRDGHQNLSNDIPSLDLEEAAEPPLLSSNENNSCGIPYVVDRQGNRVVTLQGGRLHLPAHNFRNSHGRPYPRPPAEEPPETGRMCAICCIEGEFEDTTGTEYEYDDPAMWAIPTNRARARAANRRRARFQNGSGDNSNNNANGETESDEVISRSPPGGAQNLAIIDLSQLDAENDAPPFSSTDENNLNANNRNRPRGQGPTQDGDAHDRHFPGLNFEKCMITNVHPVTPEQLLQVEYHVTGEATKPFKSPMLYFVLVILVLLTIGSLTVAVLFGIELSLLDTYQWLYLVGCGLAEHALILEPFKVAIILLFFYAREKSPKQPPSSRKK